MVHFVLLSGGSGKRLWPLSNDARSKQFLKVLRDEAGHHVSMVQRVFSQIKRIPISSDITIATGAMQANLLRSQLDGAYELVLEPERRDTAPAIMLACAHLASEQDANDSDTVVVMPIDTFADQGYFDSVSAIDAAVQDDVASLILLGVTPTYPSEKYGYILPAGIANGAVSVREFKEKPDSVTAEEYIKQNALWNCGVFAFRLGYLRSITRRYIDCDNYADMHRRYKELPKVSFDYEIVERAESIAVIPYSGTWKDLGTWNTLTEEMKDATSGHTVGIETCRNTHAINELGLPIVVLGLDNAVVVATPDGILVSDKKQSSYMKPYVEEAATGRPMYEQRLWGEYRVIDSSSFGNGAKALTKELTIKGGKQLSYQLHHKRSEFWTVVSGYGEVVLDGLSQEVRAGSAIKIPAGTLHAARAFDDLHVIEVQVGDVLAEDDIQRFGNYWKQNEKE